MAHCASFLLSDAVPEAYHPQEVSLVQRAFGVEGCTGAAVDVVGGVESGETPQASRGGNSLHGGDLY